jgi:hypothetical protein
MAFQSFKAYLEHKPVIEPKPAAEPPTISLLSLLYDSPERQMPYSQLADRSRMTFERYAKSILELKSSGLLEVVGPVEEATVKLTERGIGVAVMLEPGKP